MVITRVFQEFIAPTKNLEELTVLQCFQQKEGFEENYQKLVKEVTIISDGNIDKIKKLDQKFDVILLNNFIAAKNQIEHFALLPQLYGFLADKRAFLIRHIFKTHGYINLMSLQKEKLK